MSRVLFVCVANSGRSLMAERLFRRAAGGRHEALSAGSSPGPAAHPVVLEALRELGIDASDHVPQPLDDERVRWADVVVATCDDACPVIPGKRYLAWELPDPKGRPLGEVRAMRDEIARRVDALVAELDESGATLGDAALVGRVEGRPAPVVEDEMRLRVDDLGPGGDLVDEQRA